MKRKEIKYFKINNRKYLGAKTKLLDIIYDVIEKETKGNYNSLIDIFAGTGVVSDFFIRKGKEVYTNDFLESNEIIYSAFLKKGKVSKEKLESLAEKYNDHSWSKDPNYFSAFGNKYFTQHDANTIGNIREDIERKYREKKINTNERNVLITSLIYSADRIANSMGHYEIYIDRKIENRFNFKLIDLQSRVEAKKIYSEDANKLISSLKADVLYMDPPYNSRQYSTLYHLLDNLTRWDNPILNGKGLKPNNIKKSMYSMKEASEAMLNLVLKSDVKYIFISYNNTNLSNNSRTAAKISDEEMMDILSLRGKVKKVEIDYSPYNTGNSKLENYKEIIYICKVNTPPLIERDVKYPFNYIGGKYKLINEIKNIFNPLEEKKYFVDVFTGGANVGVNSGFEKIYCFDSNERQIEILNLIKDTPSFSLINEIEQTIKKYNLSESDKLGYEYYDGKGNSGLKKYNNNGYMELRKDYNIKKSVVSLITLIIFSFNNSINFNLKGEFNIPTGKRDFNKKMKQNFMLFSQKIKEIDIQFIHSDFRNVEKIIKKETKNRSASYYFDPPYISGIAHYNKTWTTLEEQDLLRLIKHISLKNNFVLSNSLKIGENENHFLNEFIGKEEFILKNINHSYDNSWFHKKGKGNSEILLTNIKDS